MSSVQFSMDIIVWIIIRISVTCARDDKFKIHDTFCIQCHLTWMNFKKL